MFQSTRPARGATAANASAATDPYGFNPRAPHGARRLHALQDSAEISFNPRAPHGARRRYSREVISHILFQSTRPARGATPVALFAPVVIFCFNPRAPHGARRGWRGRYSTWCCFNPRVPHGARRDVFSYCYSIWLFQSTRPARGATPLGRLGFLAMPCFNPRAPHGARLWCKRSYTNTKCFNPRAPHGARPKVADERSVSATVSIHAPRTGRDDS